MNIQGLAPGMAYLISTFQGQNFRFDSAQINTNGRVVFQRTDPYQSCFAYAVFPDNSNLQLLFDKDQQFKLTTSKSNLIGQMKIEGSVDNKLLYDNLNFENSIRPRFQANASKRQGLAESSPEYQQLIKERDALVQERITTLDKVFKENPNSFFTAFKQAGQNPNLRMEDFKKPNGTLDTAAWIYNYRTAFWDGVNLLDERLLYTPVIHNKLTKYTKELTPQHPDTIFSAAQFLVDKTLDSPEYYKYFANWITIQYDPKESTLMDPQAVYVNMIQNYFTKERAFWSNETEVFGLQQRAYEMAASLLGKKGPDVISTGLDGKQYSIYDIKKPYVVVYMFNPTCEHCMIETPKLVKWIDEWKNEVEVYAIAIDTDDKEWRSYTKSKGMDKKFINVFDPTNKSIYAKYFVDVTPEIYVLNPDRTLIAKNLKVDQIATMINRDKQNRK